LNLSGQQCDTIPGQIINCVDSLEQKQGHWINYGRLPHDHFLYEQSDAAIREITNSWFCSVIGPPYKIIVLSQGHYLNDRKVGTWKTSDYDCYGGIETEQTYFPDGQIRDEHFGYKYWIEISPDSSAVIGEYYHAHDTLKINCLDQTCRINFSDDSKLIEFSLEEFFRLKFELYRIALGIYDFNIRRKRSSD